MLSCPGQLLSLTILGSQIERVLVRSIHNLPGFLRWQPSSLAAMPAFTCQACSRRYPSATRASCYSQALLSWVFLESRVPLYNFKWHKPYWQRDLQFLEPSLGCILDLLDVAAVPCRQSCCTCSSCCRNLLQQKGGEDMLLCLI